MYIKEVNKYLFDVRFISFMYDNKINLGYFGGQLKQMVFVSKIMTLQPKSRCA